MDRRLTEALRAYNRSEKRHRALEATSKITDENVAHSRTCSACEYEVTSRTAKMCEMCGERLAEIEDEITYSMGLPEKSPHSASEDDDEDENEDEDEKRLRGGYGMRSGESQKLLLASALKKFR